MTNPSVNCPPLDIVSKDGKMIKYRPELRRACKSVTSAILLQQIIFHWENKGRNPFYKFKDICSHSLYKTGDSWCEELGFSKKEFDKALKNIAYKEGKTGKVDREGKALPFIPKEFAFVIVYTDKDRITWYTINPKAVNLALNGIYYENDLWSSTIQNHQKAPTKINNQRGFTKDTKKTTKNTTYIFEEEGTENFSFHIKLSYKTFLKNFFKKSDIKTALDLFSAADPPFFSQKVKAEHFALFWDWYPRKLQINQAQIAWNKLSYSKDKPTVQEILSAIVYQMDSSQWKKGSRWIAYPTKWIENRLWSNDPASMVDHSSLRKCSRGKTKKSVSEEGPMPTRT